MAPRDGLAKPKRLVHIGPGGERLLVYPLFSAQTAQLNIGTEPPTFSVHSPQPLSPLHPPHPAPQSCGMKRR